MKWGRKIAACCLGILFALCLMVPGLTEAAKKVVAVMPLDYTRSGGNMQYAGDVLTEELINVLTNSGSYTAIERTQLNQAVKELGLGQTGLVDPGSAMSLGKFLGAQYLMIGKVTIADVAPYEVPIVGIRGYKGKVGLSYRLLDVKTGKILMSDMVEDTHSETALTGGAMSNESILHKTCTGVAEKVLKQLRQKNPVMGTVLDVDGKKVYIDLGSESGVKVKDELMVYQEGAPIYDRQGVLLTTRTKDLGEVKLEEVFPDYSIGKITAEKGTISRGALVKREEED